MIKKNTRNFSSNLNVFLEIILKSYFFRFILIDIFKFRLYSFKDSITHYIHFRFINLTFIFFVEITLNRLNYKYKILIRE